MTMPRALLCVVLLLAGLPSFGQPPAEEMLPLVQAPPRPEDEKAIRDLFEHFAEAWNAADADRLSELFVPEGGRVRSNTDTFDGRERVRGFFAEGFGGRYQGTRLTIASTKPRFRGAHDASVLVTYDMAPSAAIPRRSGFEALVSVVDGRWALLRLWSSSFDIRTPAATARTESVRQPARPLTPVSGVPEMSPVPQAVRVGGNISEPTKIVDVRAVYPDVAKQARVQGVVILECTIGPAGDVIRLKVLRGIPLLDQAAIDAVSQWRYEPTLLDGQPIPVIMTVTVNFRLS